MKLQNLILNLKSAAKVSTQFRAYPFYKAPERMPYKKMLSNSFDF